MNVHSCSDSLASIKADCLVVGVGENEPRSDSLAQLDKALGGTLSRLTDNGDISGKPNEVVTVLAPSGIAAERLVVVGLGDRASLSRGAAFRAAGAAAMAVSARPREKVAFYFGDDLDRALLESIVCGVIVGCCGQDIYRKEKKRHPIRDIHICGGDDLALDSGRILGESANLTRWLVNEPASEIYPESFAERAGEVASHNGMECEIWDEEMLREEACGSLLAVAQGSDRPPRLVMLRHRGGKAGDPWLAIVGKGVTFDSGGLSIKPSDGMMGMKCDMAGAATMLGAMQAIARLKLPVNVIGLAGLVENMISGKSYKLGDVLTARSGKTIEVHNTDAEGRLVLADVLDVARSQGAEKIVDLATLTGACMVALGLDVVGLMSNNDSWLASVRAAAEACGEPAWPLPMFPEYNDLIKSDVADIKNVGEGRWGGAITAAKFLEEFVGDTPWVHIDIAGPAFLDKPKPWQDAGGSGVMVRTLVEIARGWK